LATAASRATTPSSRTPAPSSLVTVPSFKCFDKKCVLELDLHKCDNAVCTRNLMMHHTCYMVKVLHTK
jgi:hypothetical protein